MLNRSGSVQQLTEPEVEPVTVEEAQAHLRLYPGQDDNRLAPLIAAARQLVEQWLGRSLIQRPLRLFLDHWPPGAISLPRPPLVDVEGIVVRTADEASETVALSRFLVDGRAEPALLLPRTGVVLPTPHGPRAIAISYTAGYGQTGQTVPAAIREAILICVAHMNEQRLGTSATVPAAAVGLLQSYRIMELG